MPLVTLKRACTKLRLEGASAFFRPPPPRQGHKLTPELLSQAQALLDEGIEVPDIGQKLDVFPNTLHKAISHNRLKKKIAPN